MSAAVLPATAPPFPTALAFDYDYPYSAPALVLGKRSRAFEDDGADARAAKARRGTAGLLLDALPAPLSDIIWLTAADQPTPAPTTAPATTTATSKFAKLPPRQRRRLASASPTSRSVLLPVHDSAIDPALLRLSPPAHSARASPEPAAAPVAQPVASTSALPPNPHSHGRCMWASGMSCAHVFAADSAIADVEAHLRDAHGLRGAARRERVRCEWAFCRCNAADGRKQDVHVAPGSLAGHVWRRHLSGGARASAEEEEMEGEAFEMPVDIVTAHGSPDAALAVLLEREAAAAALADATSAAPTRTPSPAPSAAPATSEPSSSPASSRRRSPRRGSPSATAA